VRKTFISIVFKKQKNLEKKIFFVGALKVTDEKSRIRSQIQLQIQSEGRKIRTKMSRIRNTGYLVAFIPYKIFILRSNFSKLSHFSHFVTKKDFRICFLSEILVPCYRLKLKFLRCSERLFFYPLNMKE
jgi:hypothetical protein